MSSDTYSLGAATGPAVMPIVRIAVLAGGEDGGRVTDMALPTEVPLRELLPAVRRMALPPSEDGDASGLAIGDIVRVRIEDADETDLFGVPLEEHP